jgi:hypothetical protein
MPNLKHIGRLKNNKRRAIIAFRTLPGDPYSCLAVLTELLPAEEHDTLIKLVESPAGQEAYELADAMSRAYLPDGRNMLAGFHSTGKLTKLKTSEVEMTPDSKSVVSLDQLNEVIAQQRGVSLEDLAVKPLTNPTAPATKTTEATAPIQPEVAPTEPVQNSHTVLTDDELAAQLRSQADRMYKEAKRLREQAEQLSPTKKKAKTEESV